jgi:cell division transport system permease protein
VEYGQQWLEKFTGFFNLFRLAASAMAGIFFMAAVFFVANTIRLVLYSRREEIEIMQLVGASDGFIKGPIYVIGMFQGALGGVFGLLTLMLAFRFLESNIGTTLSGIRICFLPPVMQLCIVIGSIIIGWLGCYLSLRRFLK